MRPLKALPLVLALVCLLPARASAQRTTHKATPPPVQRSGVRQAVHWCVFNRPCNWTGHAGIATGIVWGLRTLDLKPEYAAAAAVLVFVGKELRDDHKWDVLGSPDSMGDLLSGVAGAYLGYRLFGQRAGSPVMMSIDGANEASLELRIPTR